MTLMLSNTDPALRRCWLVAAKSDHVGADPLPVRLVGEDWVLVRVGGRGAGPVAGRVAAFPDRCPHRRAPLSAGWIDGDMLRCGYHGWCFDGDGRCTSIPALEGEHIPSRARLEPAAGVVERDGLVFVAIEPPVTDVLAVDAAWEAGFQQGWLGPVRARVGAGLMIDNFLDLSHFPFVHAATIGTDAATRFDFEIERRGLGMLVRSEHLFPNRDDPGVARGERALLQRRRLTYTYAAPFSVCLRIDYVEAGGTNVLSFHVQPEDDDTCSIYTLIARNDLDGDPDRMAAAVSFEQKVVEEDLRLQERYHDKRLPLDLTAEVHIKVDRMTVELRRILAALVAHPPVSPTASPTASPTEGAPS
jgi:phenylpropionate dioxygenase-like ring-hydroxylating dioxygenase large terminal subunit